MAEPLWRWRELCAALGLPGVEGPDVFGFCIDSRRIEPGDLFIALPGDPGPRFNVSQRSDRDGHDFIDSALRGGAVGVLSHDDVQRSCPELKVADTLDGLWALGRAGRARLSCAVIGITGSSGKTTTKTLLAAALGAFSTAGSLNNHLGVPLSLAMTPRDASTAVYEIGTNHPGEIGPLSELVRPDVAVLLNVHQAHAGNFRDQDELRLEKLSIIKGLEGLHTFVVEDEVSLQGLSGNPRILRFGRSEAADVRLLNVHERAASYQVGEQILEAHVPGGGAHRALSLAAVIAVFTALEKVPAPALELSDELVPRGRGNRLQAAGITLIDDSYNANPASMTAALTSLASEPGRKFALLGEMLELGADGASAHLALAPLCAGLDGVFCVGAGMAPLAELLHCPYFEAADDDLLATLGQALQAGDTVLIKGSNRVFWAHEFAARLARSFTS